MGRLVILKNAESYTPVKGKTYLRDRVYEVTQDVFNELIATKLFDALTKEDIEKAPKLPNKRLLSSLPLNKILIKRSLGGIGDILVHRMIFEDLYNALNKNRKAEIDVAVQPHFIQLLIDHPYISQVLDINRVEESKYLHVVDTTNVAGTYEYWHISHDYSRKPWISLHRSDIWAEKAIGIQLKHHEGHINFFENEKKEQNVWREENIGDSLALGLTTKTAARHKDWSIKNWQKLIEAINNEYPNIKIFIFGASKIDLKGAAFVETDTFRKWMYLVALMDFIITPATGLFNLANLLHKPTISIFGNEDLRIFGKYFPESISIQRRRDTNGEKWSHCPCWRSDVCAYGYEDGVPKCLRDIGVTEVMEAFRKLYNDNIIKYPGKDDRRPKKKAKRNT